MLIFFVLYVVILTCLGFGLFDILDCILAFVKLGDIFYNFLTFYRPNNWFINQENYNVKCNVTFSDKLIICLI